MSGTLPFYVRQDDPPAKREILRAALRLFATRGLVATSIRDIAAQSGYTNPALYKHFAGKEALARHLFDTCHARLWSACRAALDREPTFEGKLDAYVGQWLALVDEAPEVIAFLSDSARALWPKASARVRRQTMIGLAQELVATASPTPRPAERVHVAAAAVQGTLAELARMIQVGVVAGPAVRWRRALVALLRKLIA
jgi:AcrR family transcriptional regulator